MRRKAPLDCLSSSTKAVQIVLKIFKMAVFFFLFFFRTQLMYLRTSSLIFVFKLISHSQILTTVKPLLTKPGNQPNRCLARLVICSCSLHLFVCICFVLFLFLFGFWLYNGNSALNEGIDVFPNWIFILKNRFVLMRIQNKNRLENGVNASHNSILFCVCLFVCLCNPSMPLSVFCFIHQKKLFYYSYSSKINTEPHLLHKTNRLEIYIYNLKPETKKKHV